MMGEAKRRGTFDERVAQAKEREVARNYKPATIRLPDVVTPAPKRDVILAGATSTRRLALMALIAMASGVVK